MLTPPIGGRTWDGRNYRHLQYRVRKVARGADGESSSVNTHLSEVGYRATYVLLMPLWWPMASERKLHKATGKLTCQYALHLAVS